MLTQIHRYTPRTGHRKMNGTDPKRNTVSKRSLIGLV
jgi:hypothetical protein